MLMYFCKHIKLFFQQACLAHNNCMYVSHYAYTLGHHLRNKCPRVVEGEPLATVYVDVSFGALVFFLLFCSTEFFFYSFVALSFFLQFCSTLGHHCKFTIAAHHSPTLVEGNCPLILLVRLVTTRLYRNEVVERCYTGSEFELFSRILGFLKNEK